MPSLHTNRAYLKAHRMGASAAHSLETWNELMGYSKRELAEMLFHLAWLCCEGGYGNDPADAVERIREERDSLRNEGII